MNENEEVLTYWDYKWVKREEMKTWLISEEVEIKSNSSLKFFPIQTLKKVSKEKEAKLFI